MNKAYIAKVPISITTENEIINTIEEKIKKNQKFSIISINLNKIMLYRENEEMKEIMKSFDCFIPDGISVVKLCKKIEKRITGVDLLQEICKNYEKINARIFLYGSQEKSVEETKKKLEKEYFGIKIVGIENGFTKEDNKLIEKINNSKANIIFVAKGSPKQEKWIYENKEKLNVNIFMGVGGAFDIVSGNIKRAPESFRKLGLEWLYRIFKEPKKRLKQIPKLAKCWYLIKCEMYKVEK